MLVFEVGIYPFVAKQIGQRRSQRWACCIVTPVVLSYPFLSALHGDEKALLAASLVLLFFTSVSMTVVSVFTIALRPPPSPSFLSVSHLQREHSGHRRYSSECNRHRGPFSVTNVSSSLVL